MLVVSERRTLLQDLLVRPKGRLVYQYDFGDSWEHDVVLEKVAVAEPGVSYPRVIGGKRACPPEDVGGYPGYAEFLEAIANPSHDEHESTLAWAGGRFDPEAFDVIVANGRLPKKRHQGAATPKTAATPAGQLAPPPSAEST